MKTTMVLLIGIVVVLALLALGFRLLPIKGEALVGLTDGELNPCPKTPNCVCSEDKSASAYIAPFVFNDAADSAWQRARQAVVAAGGTIQTEDKNYLWASFSTKWLGFVDDVELRMDVQRQVVHVRSASRLGRSDFGVNRERLERLRLLFNPALNMHENNERKKQK